MTTAAPPPPPPVATTDAKCRACPEHGPPPDEGFARFPLQPCACRGTVHRRCFYHATNLTWHARLYPPPVATRCGTCNTVYPFKFPWLRLAASYVPWVTIPAAYVLTYKAAGWIGAAAGGFGPASVLVVGALLPTVLYFSVFMRDNTRVTIGNRTVGSAGAAIAGVAYAAVAPVVAAIELQDRIMRPFTLRTDPVPAYEC